MCGEDGIMEVKNFHTSDQEQECFRSHQGEVRLGWNLYDLSVDNPFFAKITKTVEQQVMPRFDAYPDVHYRRYLYANFSADISAVLSQFNHSCS